MTIYNIIEILKSLFIGVEIYITKNLSPHNINSTKIESNETIICNNNVINFNTGSIHILDLRQCKNLFLLNV